MGYLYEELIRKFSELSNETAGEHFTPREVIRLMVNLLFIEDDDAAHQAGHRAHPVRPGLRHRRHALGRRGPPARAQPAGAAWRCYGQELNAETYAICRSDMMLKGQDASHIALGNSLLRGRPSRATRFDYLLANPPFGVEWKKVETPIKDEHETKGFAGRFGAGLPRINDGIVPVPPAHDLQDEARRATAAPGWRSCSTAHRCSPAPPGPGESRDPPLDHRERLARGHRRPARPALLQHRHLHLLLDRHQPQDAPSGGARCSSIDARELFAKMRKSLGEKRKEISADQIAEITRLYGDFDREATGSRSSPTRPSASCASPSSARSGCAGRSPTTPSPPSTADQAASPSSTTTRRDRPASSASSTHRTGSTDATTTDAEASTPGRMSVGRAQRQAIEKAIWDALAVRDPDAPIVTDAKGDPEPDPDLRDNENVPLPGRSPSRYEADADRPPRHAPSTATPSTTTSPPRSTPTSPTPGSTTTKTKIGYEIPLTRHFYTYVPPRPLAEIDAEIKHARSRDPGPARRGDRVTRQPASTEWLGSSCVDVGT